MVCILSSRKMASTLRSHSSGLFLSNSIAVAAAKCRDSLLQCTNIPRLMQTEWAENRLAEFKLWAATTGALAGDTVSLDARLITEPDTKDLVNGLLVLLTQCLEKCKNFALPSNEETEEVTQGLDEVTTTFEDEDEWWANDVQRIDSAPEDDAARDIPRGFSPWSDDSSSHTVSDSQSVAEDTSPLLEAEAEVEQIINHLARVALAIRKSGTTSRLHKADRTFDPSNHQKLRRHLELIILARGREDGSNDYHIDKEALTAIQERLILANLRRRNRYRYAQKHADKLAVDSTSTNNAGAKSTAVNVLALRQNDAASRTPDIALIAESQVEQTQGQEKDGMPHRNQVLTATSASGVAQAIEAVPRQILTPSRVAKTNITTTAAKVLYPKPPKSHSKMLQYFKCPCCFQTLPDMYREKTLWKKHMMADICPYICILEECPTPEKLYVTRHEWTEHIEKDHRQCWQCPACSTPGRPPVIFPSVEMFLHHLRETHSGSINEDQYSTIVTEAARPIPPGICRCPLCDSTGPADSTDLLDHIAEHLHSFALRSLPWPDDEPGDNEARDPGDPYLNDDNYFDQESENDSVQEVSIDSDGLASLSTNSFRADPVHETPIEVSPTDGAKRQRMNQMRCWLSPADPSSNLAAARAQRHEGTGVWFLECSTFAQWKKAGGRQVLWIRGPSGCGKTILSTIVFDHLQDLGSRCTLAFFFDYMDIGKQTFECLLRSLAWQLYRFVPGSRGELESLHTSCHDGATQPDISRLSVCVRSMIQSSSSEGLSVIIDALDECTTGRDLWSWLETIMFNSPSNINFMVTERRLSVPSYRLSGRDVDNRYLVTMDLQVNRHDMTSYVDARLKEDTSFTMKQIPQDLQREICTTLVDGSHGMFLWVVMQLDSLASCQSLATMRASLQTLPMDYIETYNDILRRLPPNYRSDAIRLLYFLACTNQPLATSEAIAIIATQIDTDPPRLHIENGLFEDEELLQYCPSLLSFVPHSPHIRDWRKIRLRHSTVKKFLLGGQNQFRESASIAVTRTALTYLRNIDIEDTLKEVSARFPLVERAAQVVVALARVTEVDDDVFSEILSFLLDSKALDRLCRLSQISIGDHRVSPLFIACNLGLQRVTRRLLEDGVDVNEGSGTHHGALFVASQGGHVDVVRILLDRGTDVNAVSDTCGTALQAASENGHLDVVRLLLDHGADIDAFNEEDKSPVTLASSRGHSELVDLLLLSGAKGTDYALYEASYNGHDEVVKVLLAKVAGVLRDLYLSYIHSVENSALGAAMTRGHGRIVEILRLHILCQAVTMDDYSTVEALLDDGVSPNGNSCIGTPLDLATEYRNLSTVKLLLERGAYVSTAASGDNLVGHYKELGLETTDEIWDLLREHRSRGFVHGESSEGLFAVLSKGH